jgi:hypothetical protein
MKVPATAPGRVWKPVYWVVLLPVTVEGTSGYWDIDIHAYPPSWQEVQPEVTPLWIWLVVGAGVRNSDPGTVLIEFGAIGAFGVAAWWQVAQSPLTGMCAAGEPAGETGGSTMMLSTPTNVVTPAP